MDIKLDENMPNELAVELRRNACDVHTCHDEAIAGATDATLLERVRAEGRFLLTFDLDFTDIRKYPPGTYPGIIVLRLHSQDIDTVKQVVVRFLTCTAPEALAGNLTIVEETRVRIRDARP